MVLLYARGRLRGRLVMVLGAIYGGWRLLIEPVRAVHPLPFLGGPLTTKQVASLLIVVFCTTYLFLDRLSVRRAERRSGPGIAC
ncbi:MAG: hypothetical protein IRY99_09415 [Isosphaeraceae bacterium]|nr:hypothetical protein [Isosphaeraceae bacterium]